MDERNTYQEAGGETETEGIFSLQEERGREQKAARTHFSRLGGRFLLGTVTIFAAQTIVSVLAYLLKPEWLENSDIAMTLSILPLYLIGMPVLILLVRRIPGDRVERRAMRPGQFVTAMVLCFGAVYIANIFGLIITALVGFLKGGTVENPLVNIGASVSLWWVAVYMVICAPVVEEYVFRKLIVDRTVRYGEATAVLLSGVMFGLFHGNLNQFAYAFVLGAFLAFLYVKTGNLKITIALHMLINFMGGFVSFLLARIVDVARLAELADAMDMEGLEAFVIDNIGGILAYGVQLLFIFGCMIAGLVLFILCLTKKRIQFRRGQVEIPKRTVFLNLGMILYSVFWLAVIVWQLFQ